MQQFGIEFNQLFNSSTSLEKGNTPYLLLNEHSGEALSNSTADLPNVIPSNLLGESLSESIYCNTTSDTLTEYSSAREFMQQTTTVQESIYNTPINMHNTSGVVGLEHFTNHLVYLSISNSSQDEWNKSKDRYEEAKRSLQRLDASLTPNRFTTKSLASLYKSKLESAHSMTKRESEIEQDIPNKATRPMQSIRARTRSYSTKNINEKTVVISEQEDVTIEEIIMREDPLLQGNHITEDQEIKGDKDLEIKATRINHITEDQENKGDKDFEMKAARINHKKDMNNAQEKPAIQRIARIKRKPNKEWPMEDAFYSNKHKKRDEIPLYITSKPSSPKKNQTHH